MVLFALLMFTMGLARYGVVEGIKNVSNKEALILNIVVWVMQTMSLISITSATFTFVRFVRLKRRYDKFEEFKKELTEAPADK
jgi:hypothetical protein